MIAKCVLSSKIIEVTLITETKITYFKGYFIKNLSYWIFIGVSVVHSPVGSKDKRKGWHMGGELPKMISFRTW